MRWPRFLLSVTAACLLLNARAQTSSNVTVPTGLLCNLLTHPEWSVITDAKSTFGWIVPGPSNDCVQTAWQIRLFATQNPTLENTNCFWDSGKVVSSNSINLPYLGPPLSENKSYTWMVRTWDAHDLPSDFSAPQTFNTGVFSRSNAWPGESRYVALTNINGLTALTFENREPIAYHPIAPVRLLKRPDGAFFADFGRAAFAGLDFSVDWTPPAHTNTVTYLDVDVGELNSGNSVNLHPHNGVVYGQYRVPLQEGVHQYHLDIPRFKPKYPFSQDLPAIAPEVVPFRYAQFKLAASSGHFKITSATQLALWYQFNDAASDFQCSDAASQGLNAVYQLCKYSLKANTFNGDYANSERERMLYEADVYIQQMGHYAVDREFAIARYSWENMLYHTTWPTEWSPHCVFMAYDDFLYTGDTNAIARYYSDLKAKTLIDLAGEDGLISTRMGKVTPEFEKSIHFAGKLRDVVDWPPTENDNYVFCDVNTVVNAFHYRSLVLMEKIAAALGKTDEATFFRERAAKVYAAFNSKFFVAYRGLYRDGIGSDHCSFHASMFALDFGLVPPERVPGVLKFLESRGMVCSVYAANYFLEALGDQGAAQYARSLLVATNDRSWLNMIRMGSTITTEAWDNKYKSNNGWTHAWSSSPAHIIPRKLAGIEPLEPGFGRIRIRPQVLANFTMTLPTIRGPITVSADHSKMSELRELTVEIPANTTAEIYLPASEKARVTGFGNDSLPIEQMPGVKVLRHEANALVAEIPSGHYHFRCWDAKSGFPLTPRSNPGAPR